MKVMAVAKQNKPFNPEQSKEILQKEVPATLQHYLDGKIEQFWFQDKVGPIFLMNVESLDDAKATLDTLPLVEAGYMSYTLMPVGPLFPLGRLIQNK
jgi:hypothetical protein